MAQRGFTLIEMAIVLIIAGLLLGGGLLTIGPLLDKARTNQTSANMDQVENALVLFVIRNNRLPCPAEGNLAPSSALYGLEVNSGGAQGGSAACGASTSGGYGNGVVPWRTLGIDESVAIDGWGNLMSYYAAQASFAGSTKSLTDPTVQSLYRSGANYTNNLTLAATDSFMVITDATSGKTITPTTSSVTTGSTTQILADQAAYVLISHGKSGWYAWGRSGGLHAPSIAGGSKACNSLPGSCSVGGSSIVSFLSGTAYGAYPATASTYFDDIVRWRSPAMLIQLCGTGACGN